MPRIAGGLDGVSRMNDGVDGVFAKERGAGLLDVAAREVKPGGRLCGGTEIDAGDKFNGGVAQKCGYKRTADLAGAAGDEDALQWLPWSARSRARR